MRTGKESEKKEKKDEATLTKNDTNGRNEA